MTDFTLYDTHKIAGHYLSYLINNDASGLDSKELAEANEYMKSLPPRPFLEVVDDGSEFARCRVTDLMADCIAVDIYTKEKD